jgi:hypothetical protein
MVERRVQEQEIRPKLGDRHGGAINQEINLYLGGMSVHV